MIERTKGKPNLRFLFPLTPFHPFPFPVSQGKAGAGGFPPRRTERASPHKRGLKPLRSIPPCASPVTLQPERGKTLRWKEGKNMANLDWSQCPAVESIPGKVSGAWVFKDTRMPVSIVFENLESGATIEEIMEWFHVTREQIVSVLEFAARSLDVPPPVTHSNQPMVDARSL